VVPVDWSRWLGLGLFAVIVALNYQSSRQPQNLK